MSAPPEPIRVDIMDKEYLIACPDEEREQLYDAVKYLNQKLRELKGAGRIIGAERIAVMTALNITSELLQYKKANADYNVKVDKTVKRLFSKIEGALGEKRASGNP